MPVVRGLRRAVAWALVLLPLATTGCGLAAALAYKAISDAIDGNNGDGGDPTVLVVANDAASVDAIVEIRVARADGTKPPASYPVDRAPGASTSLRDVFDAGPHWVRVVYASGWRSRARSITVVKDDTVSMTFLHGAPALAPLAGTWVGGGAAATGTPHAYAMTLGPDGQASARTVDGVAGAATGVVSETSEGVYRVTWSDATVSALLTDAARAHAGFVGGDGSVAALEKDATGPLPSVVDADVVGTWVGAAVRLVGATLAPSDVDAASATVSAQQHWQGTDGDGDGSTGVTPLLVVAPSTLGFACDAEDDAAVALDLGLWLTPDGAFAVVVRAPATGGTFPDAGVFDVLERAP